MEEKGEQGRGVVVQPTGGPELPAGGGDGGAGVGLLRGEGKDGPDLWCATHTRVRCSGWAGGEGFGLRGGCSRPA